LEFYKLSKAKVGNWCCWQIRFQHGFWSLFLFTWDSLLILTWNLWWLCFYQNSFS